MDSDGGLKWFENGMEKTLKAKCHYSEQMKNRPYQP